MNPVRAMNDNAPQDEVPSDHELNFSWKLEYFPKTTLALVGTKAPRQQKSRPLRVLTIKLEDEI